MMAGLDRELECPKCAKVLEFANVVYHEPLASEMPKELVCEKCKKEFDSQEFYSHSEIKCAGEVLCPLQGCNQMIKDIEEKEEFEAFQKHSKVCQTKEMSKACYCNYTIKNDWAITEDDPHNCLIHLKS